MAESKMRMSRPGISRACVFALGVVLVAVSVPVFGADPGAGGHGGPSTVPEWFMHYVKVSGVAFLIFLVVLTILWKKLFPPIVEALDKRAATIRDSLEAAEKARSEAQNMIAEHEANLDKARAEGRAIVEEAKADAKKVKDGIVKDAQREADEIVDRGKRELELAKQSAVDDLYSSASRLSFDLAEKVIQKSLSANEHQGLIDSCIQQYKEEV